MLRNLFSSFAWRIPIATGIVHVFLFQSEKKKISVQRWIGWWSSYQQCQVTVSRHDFRQRSRYGLLTQCFLCPEKNYSQIIFMQTVHLSESNKRFLSSFVTEEKQKRNKKTARNKWLYLGSSTHIQKYMYLQQDFITVRTSFRNQYYVQLGLLL